jgi:hypothetical protein
MTNAANFNDYSGDGVFGRDKPYWHGLHDRHANGRFNLYTDRYPNRFMHPGLAGIPNNRHSQCTNQPTTIC